jgi:hypothetical protein
MGGFKLAKEIEPISVAMEASLILALIEELRKGLALELDQDPSFDRLVPAMVARDTSGVDYLVIGRTGPVAMMAEALLRKGCTVNRADAADWRINKSFVEHLAELTVASMAELKPKTVIVIGVEESYFMAQFEVGYTLPATKDAAGHHHINGELMVASADTQQRLLLAMEPIWKATSGTTTVVVSPMARYLTKGCCEDSGHITNRGDPGFEANMKKDLLSAKYNMKKFFKDNGHDHCVVMYPAKDLEGSDLGQIWGKDDPTMPLPPIFDKMVAAIRTAEVRADITGAKRAASGQDGPPAKKPRTEPGSAAQSKESGKKEKRVAKKGGSGGGGGGESSGGVGGGARGGRGRGTPGGNQRAHSSHHAGRGAQSGRGGQGGGWSSFGGGGGARGSYGGGGSGTGSGYSYDMQGHSSWDYGDGYRYPSGRGGWGGGGWSGGGGGGRSGWGGRRYRGRVFGGRK